MCKTRQETDAALLDLAKEGDERAFEALFERYMARIRQTIVLPPAVHRKISVSDVVQEARTVAIRRLPGFEDRGPGSFDAWLTEIVRRRTRGAIRKYLGPAKRDVAREVEDRTAIRARNLPARGPTPSEALMAEEDRAQAQRALAALPEDYREVLLLTRKQGLTIREAAEQMGRSLEATKKLSARALARFGELLNGGAR